MSEASGLTFVALQYLLQEGKVEAAQGLLASMQSAPHVSARSGWLVLLQSLLRCGYHQKARSLLRSLCAPMQQYTAMRLLCFRGRPKALCPEG